MVLAWCTAAVAWAARRKRSGAVRLALISGRSALSATERFRVVSSRANTTPIPPAPRTFRTRYLRSRASSFAAEGGSRMAARLEDTGVSPGLESAAGFGRQTPSPRVSSGPSGAIVEPLHWGHLPFLPAESALTFSSFPQWGQGKTIMPASATTAERRRRVRTGCPRCPQAERSRAVPNWTIVPLTVALRQGPRGGRNKGARERYRPLPCPRARCLVEILARGEVVAES